MTTTSDDVPPPFTRRQARTIRTIGRRCGFPRAELEDLVQIVWVELKRSWDKCPRVEPRLSKYINGIARNTANNIVRERSDDAMTAAEPFSSLDEATSTAPAKLSMSDKVLADQLVAKATARDPEGTGWMVRTVMYGESCPQVSEDVGVAADTIRKRVARLLEWLRENVGGVSLVLLFALAVTVNVLRAGPKSGPETAQSAVPQTFSPKQVAAAERESAYASCESGDFAECATLLDEAKSLDPAGENDARVQSARAAIARAAHPPAPEEPEPPLK